MADNQIRLRAKANFPTVLLTLLSIVQALALELMWTHVVEHTYLHTWSFSALLSWIQISANLLGILLIWLTYSDLVLRLSWVPNTLDALFPFLVGIMEFAQISVLGPGKFGVWFVVLSILFASMAWITQVTMKRARQDPDNLDFFAHVNPATRRDHLISAIPVAVLLVIGIMLWVSDEQGWLALITLVGAVLLLSFQIWRNHVYTQRSYA